MASIYIPYGTTEGQTAKIAEYVAEVVRARGHEAQPIRVTEAGPVPTGCDGVMIGASIHMGKHDKRVVAYVKERRAELERIPSAFYSVSLAALGDTEEAQRYVDEFLAETGWAPARIALVSGALLYTKYGFFKRFLMKRIARSKPGGLSTDTSRDHEYTDWDEIRRFTEEFLDELVGRRQEAR